MIEVCDPDANISDLKKLIKLNTGHDIKLTKNEICQVYDDIKSGKLPLPPLIMSSDKTYLVDKKSPLKPNDYEILFDSSSKRSDIKRVARKVGLKQIEQMTKSQMLDSIGKRLRYMNIYEPVKIGRKVTTTAVKNTTAVNVNANQIINNVNTNANQTVNNVNANANQTFNNTSLNVNGNGNGNVNRNGNGNVNRNGNRNLNTARRIEPVPKVSFPKNGLFMRGQRPKFLNGEVSAIKQRNFIRAGTFEGARKGYVFKTGNQGTGYYVNTGPVRVQGPAFPTGGLFKPNTKVNNNFTNTKINNKVTNTKINNKVTNTNKPANNTNTKINNKVTNTNKPANNTNTKINNKVTNTNKPANNTNTKINNKVTNTNKPANNTNTNKPTNISVNQAKRLIRQIGLRKERPFFDKLSVVGIKRSDVVNEATQYKQRESDLIIKLRKMSLTDNERRDFIKRMSRDDLGQIEAEAQIRSDERNDIVKNSEEKMKIFLATLPYVDTAEKLTFEKRAKNGTSPLEKLIDEAKKINEKKRLNFIASQKAKFMQMVSAVKLPNADKLSFQKIINDKTNLNALKMNAQKLSNQRSKEKQNVTRQNLLTYLTPLKITQNYRNELIARFNRGENATGLKRNAKQREMGILRRDANMTQLQRFLTPLRVSQNYKNEILSRFTKGENASQLKREAKKRESNLVQGEKFTQKVQEYSGIASAMNLDNTIRADIARIDNESELSAMKIRIIGAGKEKLRERAKPVESSTLLKTINSVSNVKKLVPLKNKINMLITRQRVVNMENKNRRKSTLKTYITKSAVLSQNKKSAFIQRVNANGANLDEIRKNVEAEIKVSTRQKETNDLKSYLEQLNVNRSKYLNEFQQSNISFRNIKAKINKEVALKGDFKSKKSMLASKIEEARSYDIDFTNVNTNVNALTTIENVNRMNEAVESVIQRVVNAGKNSLSNKIVESGLEINLTAVKSLKDLKNIRLRIEKAITTKMNTKKSEITNYMKGLGLNNQQIKTVINRNMSVNDSREMANKLAIEKKRLELTKILNDKKVPIANRKQFYDKLNKNANVNAIGRDANTFMKNKNKNKGFENVIKNYMLDDARKAQLTNLWKMYDMNMDAFKLEAKKKSDEYKRERELELRKYLSANLKLNTNIVENIMKDYALNPRDMDKYKNRGRAMKGISAERARITERIRKAREENGINLKFKVNIKTANDAKKLDEKINKAYIGKKKKNLARLALDRDVNISKELNNAKTTNDVNKLRKKVDELAERKRSENLKKLQNLTKNMNQATRNAYLRRYTSQTNTFENVAQNVKNAITKKKQEEEKRKADREKEKEALRKSLEGLSDTRKRAYLKQINRPNANLKPLKPLINANLALEARQKEVLEKAKGRVAKFMGMIGDWKPVIEDSKTISRLNEINKDLNKRIDLQTEINVSKIPPRQKREMMNRVMRYKTNVKQVRGEFEKILNNMEISNVTGPLVGGIINNVVRKNAAATKIQAGFRGKKARNKARGMKFERNTGVSEIYVPETNFKGEKFKVSNVNPLALESFKAAAKKVKNQQFINRVKLAAKKTAVSTMPPGPERVKAARNLAPRTTNNVKKAEKAIEIFNRRSAISTINRLKKISQKAKTNYKGQINRAKSKAELENIKTRATRNDNAIRASEEEAKQKAKAEATKKEAERKAEVARKKAAREAEAERKKAEAMKRVMNAANAYVAARKPMTVKERMMAQAKENRKFNEQLAEKRRLLRELKK